MNGQLFDGALVVTRWYRICVLNTPFQGGRMSLFFFHFRLAAETSSTPYARDPSSVADEGPNPATADGRTRGQQSKNLLLFVQTVV